MTQKDAKRLLREDFTTVRQVLVVLRGDLYGSHVRTATTMREARKADAVAADQVEADWLDLIHKSRENRRLRKWIATYFPETQTGGYNVTTDDLG